MSVKWRIVFGCIAAIVAVDQLTKIIVDRSMPLYHSIPIIDGFLSLTYVRNTGAAFGLFAGSAEIFRRPFLIVVSLVAIGFIFILLRRLADHEIGLSTALAFIVSGAIGNLIDRLLYGEVIDFIDCFWGRYHWPAFNVADSFITIGVGLTIYFLYNHPGEDPFAQK